MTLAAAVAHSASPLPLPTEIFMATAKSLMDSQREASRRAVVRRLLSVRGILEFTGRDAVAFKTFDGSEQGFGIQHEAPLPAVGTVGKMTLQTLGPGGVPVKLEMEVDVRHSVLSAGGFRSGVHITSIAAATRDVLANILSSRRSALGARGLLGKSAS